jgi:hypothetical protein
LEGASDCSYINFGLRYFETKKANLAEVEAATEYQFSQKLLLETVILRRCFCCHVTAVRSWIDYTEQNTFITNQASGSGKLEISEGWHVLQALLDMQRWRCHLGSEGCSSILGMLGC